jgi:ATP-dependent helicase/nuclease subunit A
VYARALQRYGVPHAVTGGGALNEVPELELLWTCVAAITRPHDPIALAAALRSELFGVADTVLYEYRRQGGAFSYYADIPAGLPTNDAAIFRDAFTRLQTYAARLRRMPADAALEWIAADLGLIARACAAEEGDAHAGSFLKALDLLRASESQLTAGDCLDLLSRLVEKDEQHDGVPVRPPHQAPARIMNLHQCKGLEAPFVFLVDPSGERDHAVEEHIDRSGERPCGFLPIYGPRRSEFAPPALLAHPPGWDAIAAHEQRFLHAEANRLLYVAATRAGVGLVISQRNGKSNNKNPWESFDRFLGDADGFADPGSITAAASPEVDFDAKEWDGQIAAIQQRWRRTLMPTYAIQAIKATSLPGGPKPHGAEKAGAEWGTVLHTLLETAMRKPGCDLYTLALSAVTEQGLPAGLAEEAVATVERVTASELWARASRSSCRLIEAPLAAPRSAEESLDGIPTVLRGVIDLAFRETTGWVIVDYKSERVERSELLALTRYYRPQLEAYAQVWRQIVDEPVIECGLFFTHAGEYVTV